MVPANILCRVFHLRSGNSIATGFTLEVDKRQYFVTAKHVVEALQALSTIDIWVHKGWTPVKVRDVWRSSSGADLAVLCLDELFPVAPPVICSDEAAFHLSEPIYFLGFPFGLTADFGQINSGFPIPFVKAGIIASFSGPAPGSPLIVLDGHNNPGFSVAPS